MTYHQLKYLLWSVVVGVTLSLTSCMKWDYGDAVEDFNATGAVLEVALVGDEQPGSGSVEIFHRISVVPLHAARQQQRQPA